MTGHNLDHAGSPVPIALVISSFEPGGTEHQMIELMRRLDQSQWEIHVVSLRGGPWRHRVADVAPIVTWPVHSLRSPRMFQHMWAFVKWCHAHRIALVHTLDQPANLFGLAGAALAGVPVRIANRRDVNPGRRTIELGVQRMAYTGAHRVVANCRAAADRLRLERLPERKIAIVSNGVDPSRFAERHERATLSRVVAVANLRPEKGHDVLIDAAALVLRRFPETRFDIVGGGPMRDVLAVRARTQGVAHAVRLLGHQDDVPKAFDDADVFVHPSRSEAFPNAVLEAMAAGLPIVASDVGGIPELIENERNGLLSPVGNPDALAERMCRLIADPPLAARLASAARHDARTRFSFERMVTAFEALYLSELRRCGRLRTGATVAAA
jgi:glycosyltransferase involved in cell wall biosynthesis